MDNSGSRNRLHRGLCMAVLYLVVAGFVLPESLYAASGIETSGAGLTTKVAPGDLLPLSIRLLNFGNNKKTDVTITYSITDSEGNIAYTSEETVAVETTAAFVKTIQIPFEAPPGRYVARSSIVYPGQVAPATTQFPFTVEQKILGFFLSDFYLYVGIMSLASILAGIISHVFVRHRRARRLAPIDYSYIPHHTRVFYELISDTITDMRGQVGEGALDIAAQIEGLVIDEQTGRVLKLTGKPSKVIAELVAGYEKVLGKNVSFSLRRS